MTETTRSYAGYWKTWGVLLALTALMLVLDQTPMARTLFVSVMITAMAAKAALIAGTFMHLRTERVEIALAVIIGLLFLGAFMFALMAPDAYRIARMVPM